MLESVKKDLNTDEGSFAIDELPFSINHLACRNDDDEKAMYFCLDVADIKVNRYCAVYFGDSAILENQLFLGKINDKITAEDKIWDDVQYNDAVNPKRDYKFTAYSFDVSILEKVKLWTDGKGIEKPDGTFTDDLYTRACGPLYGDGTLTYALLQPYFENKIAGSTEDTMKINVYHAYLGNLYKILDYFLSNSEPIIHDITNTNFTLNLIESSLGIQTNPVNYNLNSEDLRSIESMDAERTKRIELRLSATDSGNGWSAVFIHRKMIAPEISYEKTQNSNGDYVLKYYQAEQSANEHNYSFISQDNIASLLFEIARAFGLYLFANYDANLKINLEFKSRANIVENDFTHIVCSNKAELDTNSTTLNKNENNGYYGVANCYATDEYDSVINRYGTINPIASEKYTKLKEDLRYADKKGLKEKRLLLSISPTWLKEILIGNNLYKAPLNYCGIMGNFGWVDENFIESGNFPCGDKIQNWAREFLHTGIYINLSSWKQSQIDILGTTPVYRFASRVYTKIDGVNKDYDTLSEYNNKIFGYDKFYYETEYSLTVPSWNGFSKATDGSGASWRNIKLGSKIKLSEAVRRYDGTNWISENVTRDYVVVGIEINLQKPETKLKLHNLSRFAYGTWDGDEATLGLLSSNPESAIETSEQIKTYKIASGETIISGDAVRLLNTGEIAKSKSLSDYLGTTIGIALKDGTGGDYIDVQLSGRVQNANYSFANLSGQVFARTNDSGSNIGETILDTPTYTEDMIIWLGAVETANSFILNIREFAFESGVLPPP